MMVKTKYRLRVVNFILAGDKQELEARNVVGTQLTKNVLGKAPQLVMSPGQSANIGRFIASCQQFIKMFF